MIVLESPHFLMQKISPPINPAVMIPMHKPEPSSEEKVALIQCQKILGEHPIYLLHPEGMNIQIYQSIFPSLKSLTAPVETMASIAAYNKLMISPFIFNALASHSHLLIHEPDAIILKNDLDFWCEQDFDYIGAPWFASDEVGNLQLKATGNFGLSLINLKAANSLFAHNSRWFSPSMIVRDLLRGLRGQRGMFKRAIKAIGSSGKLSSAHHLYHDHCDIFWSYLVPKVAPQFRIAPPERAIHFSWEKNPGKCFEICQGKLPFGIHAWPKYDQTFIKPLLIQSGVLIDNQSLN